MDKQDIFRYIDQIDYCMGCKSTDEQREFAYDFTKPLYSFSNPGTGKSHSIITGILLAETVHGVPGCKINAMSYTKLATAELAQRYERAIEKCHMDKPDVKFNTFHSICRSIIKDKYPDMESIKDRNWSDDIEVAMSYLKRQGYSCDDNYYIKKVIQAIDALNHVLVFDDEHVSIRKEFKELKMDLNVFQTLRRDLFKYELQQREIPQGDLPNFALYVLLHNKSILEKYRSMYEIMIVDEFQDMTKLYLKVLSLISGNLIVIGDLKQQIYGYNGACAEIVDEYLKLYPNARRVDLTKSFRCKTEISDYATAVYYPNDVTITPFKGTGDGGTVQIIQSDKLPLKKIVESIKEEYYKDSRVEEKRDTMFLFRNNFSVTPVAEELYQQGVPFRVNKFSKVFDLPIYKELTILIELAEKPEDRDNIVRVLSFFPELQKYGYKNNPVLEAYDTLHRTKVRQGIRGNVSFFDLPYEWKEDSSIEIITILKKVKGLLALNKPCIELYEALMPVYEKYIIKNEWWRLPQSREFYDGLVAPIIARKTFREMISDEVKKEKKILDAIGMNTGVKCYTMHSAKGLEADDVFILDAEDSMLPNEKRINKDIERGYEYDAAKAVREERNLLYVAITRAKDNVVITYREQLTDLIANPLCNKYSFLDEIYTSTKRDYDDVKAFLNLLNLNDGSEKEKRDMTYISRNDELDISEI